MSWSIVVTALVTGLLIVVGMNFVLPEKRIERHVERRYGVADPQFQREMGVLMGPVIVAGTRVADLQNGVAIFPAMLEAIRAAKATINFETYIYWSGTVGKAFADALSERARAGVAVSVILDWAGSVKMEQALLDELARAGVRVERYRPLHWYNLGRMNNRTHRKLLIVDGRVAFTGGVGVADHWQGDGGDPDHWRDMHFRLEGPVVAQFQAAFNDNWIKISGQVLNGDTNFPKLEAAGPQAAHLFIASPAGGSDSMHLMYLLALAAAERTIDLEASYFVPDELIAQALDAARQRGVRVRILVPGAHIDSDAVRLASKASWGRLLQAGATIYEYQPTMLHCKLLIVDGEMVSVGSTNFDPRSFRLNDEASLNVYDTAFGARMTEVFEHDIRDAVAYTYDRWNARPLREKLMERLIWPLRSQL